jgi:O-antigen/teichoic acid export membrane protein
MKRGIKNLLLVTLGELIGPLLGFFVLAYLARTLGVANFGMINFAQAIFSYGLLLNYLGLPTLGTREIARNLDPGKITSSILSLRLFLSLLGFILISIISLILPKNSETKTLVILYGVSIFTIGLFLDWFYQGKEAMQYLTYSRIINYSVYFIFILILIRNKNDFYLVPIGFLLSNLSVVLFQLIVYRKRFGKLRFGFNWKDWKGLLKLALPLGAVSLLIQFGQYFTPSLLGFIKGNIAVGYFSAAAKLVLMIAIVDRVFSIIALPMITRYHSANNPDLLNRLLNRLQKLLLAIVLPIVIGGIILAKEIIVLVFGRNYLPAAPVFQILIFFFGITIFVSLYGTSLIAVGKESRYARSIGTGTLTNVILNPFLATFFGAIGSAIAVVLAEAVTLTFAVRNYRLLEAVPGSSFKLVFKPILATCLMAAFLLLLPNINIFLRILGSIIIYGGFIFLIKGLSIRDLELKQQ